MDIKHYRHTSLFYFLSIFIPWALWFTVAGYFNEIFATHPMSKVIQTGLLLLISFYLIIDNKTFFYNKLKYNLN